MLVRQKIIAATAATWGAIVVLATFAYILSADRIGRQHLAPEISRIFANVLQHQIEHAPNDTMATKSLAKTLADHYQIQEIAIYNQAHERIIYVCSNGCLRSLPKRYHDELLLDDALFFYDLEVPKQNHSRRLVIETEQSTPRFFYMDTIISSLFVYSVSTLLIFFLYNTIRHWQKQPFIRLLRTIEEIQSEPDDKIRFETNDADTANLCEALNDMIGQNEERERSVVQAREKAESARIRAIRLSNETRHINEKLAQEITIRRSVENQLKHTQNFLDSIIDSMPSALFAVDSNGFIQQCNKQAAEWLASRPEPLSGQRLAKFFESVEDFEMLLSRCHMAHEVQKLERVVLALPAETFVADVVIYPLKDPDLTGLVVRIDDIRQRQQMEEIIVQTEKMRSVGGLAAGMAHEINNPLGAILQGVQNIQRRIAPENDRNLEVAKDHGLDMDAMYDYLQERQVTQFIGNIQDAGKRAASIVSNMLQFSRGNSQTLVESSASDLLERTLNIAHSDLDLRKIAVTVSIPNDLPMISCIPSEMEQVLLNILQNAAHAMVHAEPATELPRIDVEVSTTNEYLIISIKDNGPGMDDETSRKIFEPFFTTKDIGAGTGLGLSVSYFIITAHHRGQLSVDTAPNMGACFTIKLPLRPLIA